MPSGKSKKGLYIAAGVFTLIAAGTMVMCLWARRPLIQVALVSVRDSEPNDPHRPWLAPANGWPGIRNVVVDVTYAKDAEIGSGYIQVSGVKVGNTWRAPPTGFACSDTLMNSTRRREATFTVPSNVEALQVHFNYMATTGLGRFVSPRTAGLWLQRVVRPVSRRLFEKLNAWSARTLSPHWARTPVEIRLPRERVLGEPGKAQTK